MKEMREGWRRQVGLADREQRTEDERLEMEALASIPKIYLYFRIPKFRNEQLCL